MKCFEDPTPFGFLSDDDQEFLYSDFIMNVGRMKAQSARKDIQRCLSLTEPSRTLPSFPYHRRFRSTDNFHDYFIKARKPPKGISDDNFDIIIREVRDLSYEEAKQELLDYVDKNKKIYLSKILTDLWLDVELVLEILGELKKEGAINFDFL